MLISLLLLCSTDVLTVDPSQGPYTEIRAAVAAANSGDVIRVAGGTYDFFGVFGKTLTIVRSNPTQAVTVQGSIRIQNLSQGQTVSLAGIDATSEVGSDDPGLVVANCDGAVRVEDGTFIGRGDAGIKILGARDVVLTDCIGEAYANACLLSEDSHVTVFRGTYVGAQFALDPAYIGSFGSTAIQVMDGSFFSQGATIRGGGGGGDDGGGTSGCNIPPGDGGPGIFADDADVEVLGGSVTGGPGGFGFFCPNGLTGPRFFTVGSATVIEHPGSDVYLSASRSILMEGRPLTLSLVGDQAGPLLLVAGLVTSRVRVPGYTGRLFVGGSTGTIRRVFVGNSPGSLQLTMPQLPLLGVEHFYLQAVQLRPGQLVFGGVRRITVIDSAW